MSNRKANPTRRIFIKNFGALGSVELTLNKPLMVMIGPQASGKSTLGKVIYFCRKIRDYLTDYARKIWDDPTINNPYGQFMKDLKNPFMGCFGTTKHMSPFTVKYIYDDIENKSVTIYLDRANFVAFRFSEVLQKEITALLDDAVSIAINSSKGLAERFDEQKSFLSLFRQQVKRVFADDENLLYIPAGRNLLATIPDLIFPEQSVNAIASNVNISRIDLITQDFIHYIQQRRGIFRTSLDEITETYLKTVNGNIKYQDVKLACRLIKTILKGEYVYDKDGEKLYYDERDHWIRLLFGSSGQQEVLWALNCIYLSILQNEKTFLVFEEPESHIFPDSQQVIAQLVALMINSTKSEVFLTTHSPYMLTSFNLLLYSGKIEKETKSSVVEKRFRLLPEYVDAYFMPSSKADCRHLIDGSSILIDAEMIDRVSEEINSKMSTLLMEKYRQEEANKT